jgi:translation initiation factor IF-3
MNINDALDFSFNRDLDLVQFTFGTIPTCRVLDYSKYKYNEEKKRKAENNNKTTLKEIQIRPSISSNDLQVKTKQITEFLQKGNPVRLRIKLKGREKANAEQHGIFLNEFAQKFVSQAKIEGKFSPQGSPIGGLVTLKPQKKQE